jgi:3-oxoacyl-[acyl-carrier-protein] synthase-3
MIKSKFKNLKISGISCAVPSRREEIIDKYSEIFGEEAVNRFSSMTGVVSRHVCSQEQTASDLVYVAAKDLIHKKSINIDTIGAIIFVTQTPDYRVPSTSCVLHKRLKLSKNCVAFDINLGCSGYVYGLQILSSLMTNSNIDRGLLLVGDTLTKCIAPEDSSSVMLFGDSGSATLVEKTSEDIIMDMGFRTDGEGFKSIIIPAGAYRNINAPKERTMWGDGNKRSDYDLYMNGTDVFSFTISEVPTLINEFLDCTNTSSKNYDSLIMHQANLFILKQVAKRCKFPFDKVPISMDRYGNTSVTSIPLTLSDKFGDKDENALKLLLAGFGIGLSWGVASVKIDTKDIYPIIVSDDFYTEGEVSHD